MLHGEINDLADFVLVHAALDRRNQRHAQPNRSKAIERAKLFLKNVRFAANDAVGLSFKAVELEIDVRAAISFSCSRNRSSLAIRLPLVFSITIGMPRFCAAFTIG